MFLLSSHFRRRLFAIRRRLLIDRRFGQIKEEILSEIDCGLKLWESPTAITMVFTYIFPTVGLITTVWDKFGPSDLPTWAKYIGYFSISYVLGLLVTAFIVKRGLMLGGSGRSAYFPGALEQPSAYAEEKDILDMFRIVMRELPMDVIVFTIGIIMSLLFIDMQIQVTQGMTNWINQYNFDGPRIVGKTTPDAHEMFIMQICANITFAILVLVAWRRRIALQRG
jgi:hypothetical protein